MTNRIDYDAWAAAEVAAGPLERLWRVEWQDSPNGRAERYAVEARSADVAAGLASRVEWTAADGVRVHTQAMITSYCHEMARSLESNHGRGDSHYADVAVVRVGP